MIFLSKDLQDPYINALAKGYGLSPTDTEKFVFDKADKTPIVLRGILKKKIIQGCWKHDRKFYFIDTGYFGNETNTNNPYGWKFWHRIVKNNLQHSKIIPRSDDRFRSFNKKFNPWKKSGRKILIAAPDEKPCKFYGFDLHEWITETVEEIKKHTDRPIEVRQREKNRLQRMQLNTLQEALDDDVYALVTFNSNAAVESIFHGIPAFTLCSSHAASPVSRTSLSDIENPYYADKDELYAWACHLAYGQIHISEMKSGAARKILEMQ